MASLTVTLELDQLVEIIIACIRKVQIEESQDDCGACNEEDDDQDEEEMWHVDLPMDIVEWIENNDQAIDVLRMIMKSQNIDEEN